MRQGRTLNFKEEEKENFPEYSQYVLHHNGEAKLINVFYDLNMLVIV